MVTFTGESGATWSYDDKAAPIGDPSANGQVFHGLAQDGRPVAIKRVSTRSGEEAERRRRDREVEIGQVLTASASQHLLQPIDTARTGADLLIVMPLASRSLSALLKNESLNPQAAIEIVKQIAQGLTELAEASVLHRDLKPANVLEVDGRWHLADFGMSRNLTESTDTYTFLGGGTAPYMAPELWSGQPSATVKTDLYALGVITYELLTGAYPFNGPTREDFRRQHLQEAPPEPTGVPAAVGRLVLRLLEKNPAKRPQDARAVIEALDSALQRFTPEQTNLANAALGATVRQSQAEAEAASLDAAEGLAEDQRTQARADLQDILEETAELARGPLPEVTLSYDQAQWHLEWERARLTLVPWPQLPGTEAPVGAPQGNPGQRSRAKTPVGDTLVAAGAVYATPYSAQPTANIVCKLQAPRLIWSLLRFTANRFIAGYQYGPEDRPHGFDPAAFADQRPTMLATPGQAVWVLEQQPLTPEVILSLLHEAIAHT